MLARLIIAGVGVGFRFGTTSRFKHPPIESTTVETRNDNEAIRDKCPEDVSYKTGIAVLSTVKH